MPDTMTPGIGHNLPPLPDLLKEETADLSSRAADLVAAAGRCHVEDEDTAGRATTLAQMISAHLKTIDGKRTERKQPILEAGRTIDAHFKALSDPLDSAKRTVVGLIDAYRREQERKAAEERRKLEEQARQAREAAEAAAQKSDGSLDAEIEATHRATEAAALEQRAAAVEGPVIQSEYGAKAIGRKVAKHEIEDPLAVFKYLLKTDKPRAIEAVSEIVGRLVRAGIREIPGARIWEETTTVIR